MAQFRKRVRRAQADANKRERLQGLSERRQELDKMNREGYAKGVLGTEGAWRPEGSARVRAAATRRVSAAQVQKDF